MLERAQYLNPNVTLVLTWGVFSVFVYQNMVVIRLLVAGECSKLCGRILPEHCIRPLNMKWENRK